MQHPLCNYCLYPDGHNMCPAALKARRYEPSKYYTDFKYSPSLKAMILINNFLLEASMRSISYLTKYSSYPFNPNIVHKFVYQFYHRCQLLYDYYFTIICNAKIIYYDESSDIKVGGFKTKRLCLRCVMQDGSHIVLYKSIYKSVRSVIADALQNREPHLEPVILMSDAASTNGDIKDKHYAEGEHILGEELSLDNFGVKAAVVSKCWAHFKRRVDDYAENKDEVFKKVKDCIAEIYKIDREAKDNNLSDQDRLNLHNVKSWEICEDIFEQLTAYQSKLEPNSQMYKDCTYFLSRYIPFTAFCHVAGVPLDNNLCEQAIRKSVTFMQKPMYFKNADAIEYNDYALSVYFTAQINVFDYVELLFKSNMKQIIDNVKLYSAINFDELGINAIVSQV